MLVVVSGVLGMTMTVVHMIDMVAVLDRLMPAVRSVGMLMIHVAHMASSLVLVIVIAMRLVCVSIVQEVGVVVVRDGGVAAVAVVRVGVLGMRFVGRRLVDHQRSFGDVFYGIARELRGVGVAEGIDHLASAPVTPH